jgi:hypothetical protein
VIIAPGPDRAAAKSVDVNAVEKGRSAGPTSIVIKLSVVPIAPLPLCSVIVDAPLESAARRAIKLTLIEKTTVANEVNAVEGM